MPTWNWNILCKKWMECSTNALNSWVFKILTKYLQFSITLYLQQLNTVLSSVLNKWQENIKKNSVMLTPKFLKISYGATTISIEKLESFKESLNHLLKIEKEYLWSLFSTPFTKSLHILSEKTDLIFKSFLLSILKSHCIQINTFST